MQTTVQADEVLLTPEQVCERLCVSLRALEGWREQKRHLPFLKVGGAIRYTQRDVDAFIAAARQEVA